jgi:DTW domain-containing protein YfiP
VHIPRAVCLRCHKAAVTCVCARIPRVDNRTSVLVLQHPRERLHPIGTARFAGLGLSRSRVEIAWRAGLRESDPPPWLPPRTALLYPGPHARELGSLPPAERPEHLLVIDGTWHTARSLYRDKLWLQALPQLRLSPEQPGNYRIRREPRADYVSTIEAIVAALRILEPDTPGLDALLRAFDAMIDQQLGYIERQHAGFRSRKRRRSTVQLRTPRALLDDFARLVVVYGEASRPAAAAAAGQLAPAREFVHFGAVALVGGERLDRQLFPASGQPPPLHLQHKR